MIRFLLLLGVFALGLAGGGLWFGQMHHLRSYVPDQLPRWTKMLPDDAGPRKGEIDWAESELLPAIQFRWDFAGIAADGLHWDVTLRGQGIDIKGDFALFFWPDRARLIGGTGEFSDKLGAMKLRLQGFEVDAEGVLQPEALRGDATINIANLAVQLEDLGKGQIVAEMQSNGQWDGEMRLRDGIAPIDATLTGQRPQLVANLEMIVSEIDGINPDLLSLIERIGQRNGNQMRITATLPGALAGF